MNSIDLEPVCIVMPVYNAESHITNVIGSVQAQTHARWRLLIVDDCSTDKTMDIVESIKKSDDRIEVIHLDENRGAPAGPRNAGLEKVSEEWIAFMDADDIWHPKKLESQLAVVRETGALFCATAMQDFYRDTELEFQENPSKSFSVLTYKNLVRKNRIPTSSVLLHRSLLNGDRFNESMRYKAVEDYDLWLRLHRNMEYSVKLDDVYVFYRKSDAQISKGKLRMARRVFMIQRETCKKRVLAAVINTIVYMFMGVYLRIFGKGL